jgi:peptidoglycan hydrolase CwlO-like protein
LKKIKNKKYFWFAGAVLITVLSFGWSNGFVFADDEDEELSEEVQEEIKDKEDDIESLEQKAKNYRRMIDLKQKQQDTLGNQLKLMQLQSDKIQNDVNIKKDEIGENEDKIKSTQDKISEKEREIQESKKSLGEFIRTYDKIEKEIALEILSNSGTITDIFNQSAYLDKASDEVKKGLSKIAEKRNELQGQQAELKEKNDELKQKKKELDEKVYYLNNEKNNKNTILQKTEGDEKKYQQLLTRVEKQKQQLLGDIDSLSDEKKGELSSIQSKAKRPSSGLASTSWYYSQKDKKWGYNRIGLSSSLMKDYGCAVTALSMVFTYHGEKISPGKMATQPVFYRDLIVWPGYWKGLDLVSSTAHGSVSWSTVDKEIKKDNPVIVFVRARGGAGHYVVIHSKDKKGKYVVHDPLFGANIYLDTTKKLVGAVYNSSVTIDQAIVYHD